MNELLFKGLDLIVEKTPVWILHTLNALCWGYIIIDAFIWKLH